MLSAEIDPAKRVRAALENVSNVGRGVSVTLVTVGLGRLGFPGSIMSASISGMKVRRLSDELRSSNDRRSRPSL